MVRLQKVDTYTGFIPESRSDHHHDGARGFPERIMGRQPIANLDVGDDKSSDDYCQSISNLRTDQARTYQQYKYCVPYTQSGNLIKMLVKDYPTEGWEHVRVKYTGGWCHVVWLSTGIELLPMVSMNPMCIGSSKHFYKYDGSGQRLTKGTNTRNGDVLVVYPVI